MIINIEKSKLKAILTHAGKSDVRFYLNGICAHVIDGRLSMVATDGHRVIIYRHEEGDYGDNAQYIISREFIELVAKGKGGKISIELAEGHAQSGVIRAPLIDGIFPKISRVFECAGPSRDDDEYQPQYLADQESAVLALAGHRGELDRATCSLRILHVEGVVLSAVCPLTRGWRGTDRVDSSIWEGV